MLVNLRGTSGSGKSTIIKQMMEHFNEDAFSWFPAIEPKRKRPIGYFNPTHKISVIGHYETPCGGCDTIPNVDKIYSLVDKSARAGYHVVFEGLLISADVKRTVALAQDHPLMVLAIDLPLEECVESVMERRRRKKPDAPQLNPKNTQAKWTQTKRAMVRLEEEGVECHWGNRKEVFDMLLKALNQK